MIPDLVFALPEDDVTAQLAEEHGFELTLVEASALRRVSATETPRGRGCHTGPQPSQPSGRNIVVAWGPGDPGNVGTLIRTAAAFGWDFGFTEGTADPWAPQVLRGCRRAFSPHHHAGRGNPDLWRGLDLSPSPRS